MKFRKWSQNLNTEEFRDESGMLRERVLGTILKHGRGKLSWFRDEDEWPKSAVGLEWKIGAPLYLLGLGIDCDSDETPINAHLYLWPVSLYFSVETRFAWWIAHRLTGTCWDCERSISLEVGSRDERSVTRWNLWVPTMSWSATTPRWRDGSLNIRDLVFGEVRYSNIELERADVQIPLPEGNLPATVVMERATWTHTRFGWPIRSIKRAKVGAHIPAVIPGKGENAWDIDDNAIHSLTTPARDIPEAIAAYVESVLRSRLRHGGSLDWQPVRNER